jgi:hypothetical protein
VTDLPLPLAERMARVTAACEAACARHHSLLEVQRAALRTDDSEVLADLADESAELLAAIERQVRFPAEVRQYLEQAQGPRAVTARQRLQQLHSLLVGAQAGVREIERLLLIRRAGLLRELGALTVAGPGNPLFPPASLDVTG